MYTHTYIHTYIYIHRYIYIHVHIGKYIYVHISRNSLYSYLRHSLCMIHKDRIHKSESTFTHHPHAHLSCARILQQSCFLCMVLTCAFTRHSQTQFSTSRTQTLPHITHACASTKYSHTHFNTSLTHH